MYNVFQTKSFVKNCYNNLANNGERNMQFIKMNGLGNDYIYFDLTKENDATKVVEKIIPRIEQLSDRHFGIGGDGVVFILPSDVADVRMRMFNMDGSEGKMCGNAIRCVCKRYCDASSVKPIEITVETASGIKKIVPAYDANGVCTGATVNMGLPIVEAEQVPLDAKYIPSCSVMKDGVAMSVPVTVRSGDTYFGTAVSMGNPHFVIFGNEDPKDIDVEKIGSQIEVMPIFPERINVEFVRDNGNGVYNMRVWERGSGETLACGTGSSAVAVAASLNGRKPREDGIYEIRLLGGTLLIKIEEDGVMMTGSAQYNFVGEIEL